ncbi:MAG: sirohydrochlorin chelatase [Planctomycetota bacterium]|nr:MAG: sirohydrochlorin chelatase [Planctomycetota bacterium]
MRGDMTTRNAEITFPPRTGLLVVGHGSREQVGVDEFLATAKQIADLAGDAAVEPCFLEFAAPDIATGLRTLVERGVDRVCVVPLLLFAAGHAKRDIPAAVAESARAFPSIDICQSRHLGCHPEIVELSNRRYDEALAGRDTISGEETALVLVGRGSRDSEATREMRQFAGLRARDARAGRVETAFVAMAEPGLEQMLKGVASTGLRRVVVQPHLLFGGVLLDRIAQMVGHRAGQHPETEWIATGRLGPSQHVARAALDRARDTLSAPPEPRPGATVTGDRALEKH